MRRAGKTRPRRVRKFVTVHYSAWQAAADFDGKMARKARPLRGKQTLVNAVSGDRGTRRRPFWAWTFLFKRRGVFRACSCVFVVQSGSAPHLTAKDAGVMAFKRPVLEHDLVESKYMCECLGGKPKRVINVERRWEPSGEHHDSRPR